MDSKLATIQWNMPVTSTRNGYQYAGGFQSTIKIWNKKLVVVCFDQFQRIFSTLISSNTVTRSNFNCLKRNLRKRFSFEDNRWGNCSEDAESNVELQQELGFRIDFFYTERKCKIKNKEANCCSPYRTRKTIQSSMHYQFCKH